MNIQDIINSGANVTLSITASDLLEVINNAITATRKELEQYIRNVNTEEYLSSKEVEKILNISSVSLWRWHDIGYLRHSKVGKRNMYLKSDVTALLSDRIIC